MPSLYPFVFNTETDKSNIFTPNAQLTPCLTMAPSQPPMGMEAS